jgi:ABC-type nitrate/sulfonate/bicarbonate transport system substrate-binding protein
MRVLRWAHELGTSGERMDWRRRSRKRVERWVGELGAVALAVALVVGCGQGTAPASAANAGGGRADSAASASSSGAPAAKAGARATGAASAAPAAPSAPERFRYGTPSTSLNYYYLLFGEAEGLYQQEGLAPEILQIPASTLLAALSAGEVDYTAGAAGGIRMAVLGQPVRLVSSVSLLNFSLVTRPEVPDGASLKGKAVGVGSRGASADRAMQRTVRSVGLAPDDVTTAVIGDVPLQWEALRSGRVAAIMASPPISSGLEREGYHVLANTASLEPAVVGGVAGTVERLAATRDRTRRLVRAEAAIVRYMKTHPEAATARIAERYQLSADDAQAAYTQVVPYYWDEYALNLPAVDATIAAERQAAEIAAPVAREQVVDASFLAELQAGGGPR